jgi:hypothetical protein
VIIINHNFFLVLTTPYPGKNAFFVFRSGFIEIHRDMLSGIKSGMLLFTDRNKFSFQFFLTFKLHHFHHVMHHTFDLLDHEWIVF